MRRFVKEEEALDDWLKFLDLRVQQTRSGGENFLFQIVDIVKNKKTPSTLKGSREGIDLSDRPSTLNLLSDWCERMAVQLKINPKAIALLEVVQARQELVPPVELVKKEHRPRDDEQAPKRPRTALEIRTQAGEYARKTFEERLTKAEEEARNTFEERMKKAVEETREIMANAEREVEIEAARKEAGAGEAMRHVRAATAGGRPDEDELGHCAS